MEQLDYVDLSNLVGPWEPRKSYLRSEPINEPIIKPVSEPVVEHADELIRALQDLDKEFSLELESALQSTGAQSLVPPPSDLASATLSAIDAADVVTTSATPPDSIEID